MGLFPLGGMGIQLALDEPPDCDPELLVLSGERWQRMAAGGARRSGLLGKSAQLSASAWCTAAIAP